RKARVESRTRPVQSVLRSAKLMLLYERSSQPRVRDGALPPQTSQGVPRVARAFAPPCPKMLRRLPQARGDPRKVTGDREVPVRARVSQIREQFPRAR